VDFEKEFLMLVFKSLKPFCKSLINYIGNGYLYCQIVKIPKSKTDKIKQVDKKLTKKYLLDLTSGKRQYRKKKSLCNYKGLRFGNTIVILKTKGEDTTKEKWNQILGTEISFKKLCIVPYKDERGKITIRLCKEFLNEIRAYFEVVISKKNETQFKITMRNIYNLHKTIRYRGLNLQISQLLAYIKILQKKHGTNYKVYKFF